MDNFRIPQLASVSDLQRDYAALIKKAQQSGSPLLVLKKNRLEAVLLSTVSFEELVKKAKLYEEKQALEAIASYEDEKQKGKLKKMRNLNELFTE